jgi:hypothetical protein
MEIFIASYKFQLTCLHGLCLSEVLGHDPCAGAELLRMFGLQQPSLKIFVFFFFFFKKIIYNSVKIKFLSLNSSSSPMSKKF